MQFAQFASWFVVLICISPFNSVVGTILSFIRDITKGKHHKSLST